MCVLCRSMCEASCCACEYTCVTRWLKVLKTRKLCVASRVRPRLFPLAPMQGSDANNWCVQLHSTYADLNTAAIII